MAANCPCRFSGFAVTKTIMAAASDVVPEDTCYFIKGALLENRSNCPQASTRDLMTARLIGFPLSSTIRQRSRDGPLDDTRHIDLTDSNRILLL